MKKVYKTLPGAPLTEEHLEQLKALEGHPIDLSDIPETPTGFWKGAVRGRLYRPAKKAISLRLDADIIEWLKKDGQGYQTRVNLVLRERMLAEKAG